ncbi:MAG: permease-like cell division protein FtsX [Cyanobacteriota bacterium]|nr:permease-like cell division protein FtsX [Cyanobacteriota bacterium]
MLGSIARFFTKILYLIQETLLGLRRGGWLNWAAVSTLMVLLFLVGISLQLSWGLEQTVQSLGSQVEISAYLEPEVKGSDLQPQIEKLEHVAAVRLIPKEQAWRDLLVDMGIADKDTIEKQLSEDNPLVDAFRVQADSTETLAMVASHLQQVQGVEEVYYGDQVVQQLGQLRDTLRLGCLTITGVLALTTVAVITTTIRLIVMARRREIEVMQLVGATAAWIYLPFILQGSLFGLVGSAAAWGLVLGSQQLLHDLLVKLIALPFLQIPTSEDPTSLWILPAVLVGLGTLLGTTSSLIAVNKSAARS